MALELTPSSPGSMTVPFLFGWEGIAILVVLLAVLGVAFLVAATTRAGAGERSEWQAYLEGRSSRGRDSAPAPQDRAPAPQDRAAG